MNLIGQIDNSFSTHSSETGNQFDIYSRLLAERMIFLRGELTEEIANSIIAQMLLLDAQSNKNISFFINSSSGSLTAAMVVYDTMKQIRADITTVCVGSAALVGAFLLSSGTKGKRYALPHVRIKLQQPIAEFQGKATDIDVAATEFLRLKDLVSTILAANTQRTQQQITLDLEQTLFLGAEEAKAYGLIDSIIAKPPI